MFIKKAFIFFVLLACFCVTANGCHTASDSVDKTDKWLDEELPKHM